MEGRAGKTESRALFTAFSATRRGRKEERVRSVPRDLAEARAEPS